MVRESESGNQNNETKVIELNGIFNELGIPSEISLEQDGNHTPTIQLNRKIFGKDYLLRVTPSDDLAGQDYELSVKDKDKPQQIGKRQIISLLMDCLKDTQGRQIQDDPRNGISIEGNNKRVTIMPSDDPAKGKITF